MAENQVSKRSQGKRMSGLGGESELRSTMALEAQRSHQHTPLISSECSHLFTYQPLVVLLTFNHRFMTPGRHVRQLQHLILPSSPLSLSSLADLPLKPCPAVRKRAKDFPAGQRQRIRGRGVARSRVDGRGWGWQRFVLKLQTHDPPPCI